MYQNDPEERQITDFNEIHELKKRKEFSDREVGLSHPDHKSFIRIN